jgi:PQQ-like domain
MRVIIWKRVLSWCAVIALCCGANAYAGQFPTAFVPGDYPTNQFDDLRTGWNPNETVLNTTNVNSISFGQLWTATLDSRVYAQPIVAMQENVAGGTHNVVFVATLNDTLYAFDANTGASLWTRSFLTSTDKIVPKDFFGDNAAFEPTLGIVSTPVYDRSTHSLYLVVATLEKTAGVNNMIYRLHQVAVSNGADLQTPVVITGTTTLSDGTSYTFDSNKQPQRPALLDANGNIYVAFGSFDDAYQSLTRGWIFAYSASTLAQVGYFMTEKATTSSDSFLGDFWAGGIGPSADSSHIYAVSGNGPYDGQWNWGDSVLRFVPSMAGGPVQHWTPANDAYLSEDNLDLGSGGALLLPTLTGTAHPYLLWTQGKNNEVYLLDRTNLTGLSTSGRPGYLASIPDHTLMGGEACYVDSTNTAWVYSIDDSNPKAYMGQFQIVTSPSYSIVETEKAATPFTRLNGATMEVSSNGSTPGTAIVWYIDRPLDEGPLTLYAYNAANVSQQLWSGTAGQWTINEIGQFIEPTVTNGMVYVASDYELVALGLTGAASKRGLK